MFDALNDIDDIPEVDLSEQRISQMLGDIKRNSRNRRIAMFAPVVLAAAVLGAMIAAPPRHGGLALVADAETPDPELPRVFGSNGVWRLAEPIAESPTSDPGPADMIQAPTEPAAPSFTLSPPDQEDLQSLPTSTSTPPTSTSGQSPDVVASAADDNPADPADLDWSAFSAIIRIEPQETDSPDVAAAPATDSAASTDPASSSDSGEAPADAIEATEPETTEPETAQIQPDDAVSSATSEAANEVLTPVETTTTPDISPDEAAASEDEDVTVAVEDPQTETLEQAPANPSTPLPEPTDAVAQAASLPATIVPQSVLVYSAHVSVTVQVVDDDSSVIDWCNTRVDWGDGSVSRVAGADDAALCTASCEYESTSSAASEITTVNETLVFEHEYIATIDASPRIFVATGDGCSYTLAELQLSPFTVVPLN